MFHIHLSKQFAMLFTAGVLGASALAHGDPEPPAAPAPIKRPVYNPRADRGMNRWIHKAPTTTSAKPVTAKVSHSTRSVSHRSVGPAPVVTALAGDAKMFIYMHESGNNPAARNSRGCRGLGQDCNNQLPTVCPNWETDYACQDAFFTAYMHRRYGSWENARAFWLAHRWW